MFDFGIPGYRPEWLQGFSAVEAAHGGRLGALAGRPLTAAWLVWDLDDDTWFADCPVLLDFAGEQVEINHHKFDDLSITWNSVSASDPVTWSTGSDFRLAWRRDPLPELAALAGQPLREVTLLQWRGPKHDLAYDSVRARFRLPRRRAGRQQRLRRERAGLRPGRTALPPIPAAPAARRVDPAGVRLACGGPPRRRAGAGRLRGR